MTDGHCFISYSTHDGLDFTRKLRDELEGGDPPHAVWYDKADLTPSYEWDSQIVDAIKSSKCVLFLISEDSTKPASNCKTELTFALRYKKPIIPLLIQKKAEQPFLLGTREWIDFAEGFDAGLAKLRKFLRELNEPIGILRELQYLLGDAEHELRRAKGNEEKRIRADVDELKKQIEVHQKIVKNPKAAQEQTQKNIEAGLERERRPEKETKAKDTSTKFINPPPGIAPNYFQDRLIETKQIVDFLNDDAQRLMTVVGRGGVGKTVMVCRLLKGLEGGELPDGLGKMRVEGIVYLSESGSHRVNFANLFYDLCKLLPSDAAQELDAVYKNPQSSTESKMRALLEKFGGGRVVALLDNFEPLVDTETFAIRDAELDEALRAFLNGTHTAVNIVITTRVAPRALNLIQPGRQRVLTLDEGLESPYAENILREMDSDGRLGLKSAGAEALNRARIKTRGFPRALEALFAILASDRYTTLEELLAMPLPENVVEALVGEAFNRLDTNAQKVMQALAVYNRPVTPAAVDYLLAPHLPAMDSAPILQRLANMHFARKESGRFYLHPVDREFAFGLIPQENRDWRIEISDSDESQETDFQSPITNYQSPFTQHDLTLRAADYFAAARKPRAEWKKLEDLSAQLAEFDLRCTAGDYDTAADVLTDIDFDYLLLWGHYRLMIDLHEKLQGRIFDKTLARGSAGNLGHAYMVIGKIQIAIKYYEQVLESAYQDKDKYQESGALGSLGSAYAALGNVHKGIEFLEQALVLRREIRDREGEEGILGNLGNRYAALGNTRKAIEYYEQALAISREIGDQRDEENGLICLGNSYSNLGEYNKSINFYQQALTIIEEIGDRKNKAYVVSALGSIYIDLDKIEFAIKNFRKAIEVSDDILLPILQNESRCGLAQVYLFQNDLVNARAIIEAALGYDVPQNNHNISALHGIIALRQGDEVTARGAFVRAIGQADEILSKTAEYYSALDAKGLALCGLALCARDDGRQTADDGQTTMVDGQSSMVQQAIETFRKARKIAPHAGIVKRNLRLFDELAKCDKEGILKDVRQAVEGKEG